MKILKFRYFLIAVLVIIIAVVLGSYFIGGLKARASLVYDNEEFDSTKFESYADIPDGSLDSSVLVYNNGTYTMFFDEKTTIVRVVQNSSCPAPDRPNLAKCKVVYESADSTSLVDSEKSNFSLRYYLADGTINSTNLTSWANSVNYRDSMTGEYQRHYSVSYLEDGVDILYEIGNFVSVDSFFPSQFSRSDYDNLFRGNMVFYTLNDTELSNQVGDIVMRYKGGGETYSAECAAYLEEKGYTVTEQTDYNGVSSGYWRLDGLADSDGRLKLQIGVDYNTTALSGEEGYSPCTANPFTNYSIINYLYGTSAYELEGYLDGVVSDETKLNQNHREYTEKSSQIFNFRARNATLVIKSLLKYMYNQEEGNTSGYVYYSVGGTSTTPKRYVYYDYDGDGELEQMRIGGFQDRDEEGRFLYDEDGNPKFATFTQELAEIQNQLFGHAEESKPTRFKICLRFRLTEDGFNVTVLNDSIEELSDSSIFQIELLPYFTVNNDNSSKGQIIVPDGSGAIISFNSVKDVQNASTYLKKIYGEDTTLPKKERGAQSQEILLGMYGFLDFTKKRGVVAIVDKGASMSWIQADFLRARQTTSYNYARFITDFRARESVSLTSGSLFNKWTETFYKGDIKYVYRFLGEDELTYVDVAREYREYLLEKYASKGLSEDGDKTIVHTPTIEFVGAFEKKTLTMGIVHDKKYSLTTFEQAIAIMEELKSFGVEDMDVAYSAWTKDSMETKITKNPKASNTLGGSSDLNKLCDYLKQNGYSFYPYVNVSSGAGSNYPYAQLKYSPKSITADYSTISQFVAATGLVDTARRNRMMLSPRFYQSYINNYLKKVDKYDFSGILLDVGGSCIGDYAKKNLTYTETSIYYQQEVLETAVNKIGKVMLDKPYDYALPYVSVARSIPMVATMYPSIDYSIPLYQLVVSGLFDYSGVEVNINDDKSPNWYFLKAIETGSNLAFILSYEDTKILLDTYYNHYYGTYYINWKYKIINLNKQLNEIGIYESRLVNHQIITDNVVKVQYENGLTIMINYDDATYQDRDTGLAIAANWYIIVQEGE